ncbi:uncharacterized protein METZ01_LOCUS289521, partial [marine metagenome]
RRAHDLRYRPQAVDAAQRQPAGRARWWSCRRGRDTRGADGGRRPLRRTRALAARGVPDHCGAGV